MQRTLKEEYLQSLQLVIQKELEKGIKDIMADDIYPETIPFMLAKLNLIKRVSASIGIKTKYKLDRKVYNFERGWRLLLLGYLFHKSGLFNKYSHIKLLDLFLKIPTKLKPKWYLEMDGHKIFVNEGDRSMRSILYDYTVLDRQKRIWEPETTKIVKDNVKKGDICLDIGASIGYYTMLFARQVSPTGKVFSFEVTPNQIPYIYENVRKNGYNDRVKIFNVGAWDKTDEVDLPLNASIKYKSKCIAIDDVLESEKISKVDFIKIDVDGVEPKVLHGLQRTFEHNPDLKMVIEYYPKYIVDAGLNPKDFMSILNKYFIHKEIPGDYSDGCWNYFCKRKRILL